ncbi:MAG: carboxypeptidase-like regulatory domain-containing protein, partial [Candidatus Aenigmarchaeota archaeon]|nr:carboxypeptidase-like regulatory domain-containing protein [Candidatus Aenigmarchaeota archaeon]
STTGIFNLNVVAKYKGAETASNSNVEVKLPLEFDLVSIDKTWIKANDNITLTFKTMFKGSGIDLRNEYLNFLINSVDADIIEIYRSGEYSYVKISAPNLAPGNYNFGIKFTYMGFVKEITKEINYVVPISGSIIDSSNKPITTQLKFRRNTTETTFITSSSGSYSGDLPPGIYDIEITFPNSKLTLTQVTINEFNNPIKYDNPSSQVVISGLGTGGIFVYEIAFTYSNAYLEMTYDDSKILDESRMVLYKCENWNFGRKICNADWKTVDGQIDTVRNTVKINTTSLSAFLIGYKKDLFLNFDTDKDEYSLKEIIKITGIIQDEDSKPVSGVQITANIPNTSISSSTKSDDGGVFSLEFQAPDKEGDFTIFVKAEKSPFTTLNKTASIKLFKSEKITILMPDSIKVNQGGSSSMWISIVNTGQIDYSRLTLSLSGIPDDYYTMPNETEELKAGGEKKISIDFKIPNDAGVASHTGKLKVNYGNNSLEQQFILSVSTGSDNKTVDVPIDEGFKFPSIFTGKFVFPTPGLDVLSIILIVILVFLISILLKRKKLKTEIERTEIKNTLLDIKGEIGRRPMKKRKNIKKLKKKKSK